MQTNCQKALTCCWEIVSFASGCLFLQHRLLKVVRGFVCERVVCANTRILTFIWISKRNVGINWERTWKHLEGKTVSTGCIMSSLRCGGMSAISQREGPIFSLRTTRCFKYKPLMGCDSQNPRGTSYHLHSCWHSESHDLRGANGAPAKGKAETQTSPNAARGGPGQGPRAGPGGRAANKPKRRGRGARAGRAEAGPR